MYADFLVAAHTRTFPAELLPLFAALRDLALKIRDSERTFVTPSSPKDPLSLAQLDAGTDAQKLEAAAIRDAEQWVPTTLEEDIGRGQWWAPSFRFQRKKIIPEHATLVNNSKARNKDLEVDTKCNKSFRLS
jgi:hypothetical protein